MALWTDWTDVTIDGIPLGDGYGIEVEIEARAPKYVPEEGGETFAMAEPPRLWLTKRECVGGPYLRQREVWPPAVVRATAPDGLICEWRLGFD